MTELFFASDNGAGVLPEVWEALAAVRGGDTSAYGDDAHTARCRARLRETFGEETEPFLVWGGTAANVLALRAVCDSYHAVLCGQRSHLMIDECGAPTRHLGGPLLPLPTRDGKITPDVVRSRVEGRGVVHSPQPRVLSITQPTEVGTVYTVDEVRALAAVAHGHGLLLHVDGARLPLAAEALRTSLRGVTFDAGVDLLSFGGTKAGLLGAEAVVFARAELVGAFEYHRKQGMQLASKMRFLAAQVDALLTDELWRRGAARANAAAARLAAAVEGRVQLAYPRQTNGVFVRLPAEAVARLEAEVAFYTWEPDPAWPVVRWMTHFATTDADVDAFAARIHASLS